MIRKYLYYTLFWIYFFIIIIGGFVFWWWLARGGPLLRIIVLSLLFAVFCTLYECLFYLFVHRPLYGDKKRAG